VALERFHAWWLMEDFNVWWPLEGEKEASFFTSSHFPPTNLLKPSFFN
jgi:hypothetical protein